MRSRRIEHEERHIAEAIAVNLREMMRLDVPIIAAVIGEGGSGGALGIGVADTVLILENAYYSVISPEGCAAILWKDRKATPQAAEALKITGRDLLEFKLVDEVIAEPDGGAHHDPAAAAATLPHRPDPSPRTPPRPALRGTPPPPLRQVPRDRPLHHPRETEHRNEHRDRDRGHRLTRAARTLRP